MVESTLSLTYSQLKRQVAYFLGYGRNASTWPVGDAAVLDDVIQSGIRQFYHPPIVAGTSHQWSFLRPTATLIIGPAISGTLANTPVLHGGHLCTIVATASIFDTDVVDAYVVFDESNNKFLITEYLSDTTVKASHNPELAWGEPIVSDIIATVGLEGNRTLLLMTTEFLLPDMVGDYVEFATTSNRYEIVTFKDVDEVYVQGDASAETDQLQVERDVSVTVQSDYQDGVTILHSLTPVFRSDMIGHLLWFVISGNFYSIASVEDEGDTISVNGDASAEAPGGVYFDATVEITGALTSATYDGQYTWFTCYTKTNPHLNALVDMYVAFPGRDSDDVGVYEITASQWSDTTNRLSIMVTGHIPNEIPDLIGVSFIVAQKAFLSVGVPTWTSGLSTVTGPASTFAATDVGLVLMFLESQNKYEIVDYVSATQVKVAGNAGGEEGAQNCAVVGPAAQGAGDTFTLEGYRGEDYLLPADFGGIEGQMTFGEGEGRPSIPQVSENQIRVLRQRDVSTAQPQYFAVRPKTVATGETQRFQLLLWPEPDDVYNLSYIKVVLPNKLSDANPYPLGGMAFSEVVLESCLSVAEQRLNDEKGIHWSQFMERLTAAVIHDRTAIEPQYLGYCGDNSDAVFEGSSSSRYVGESFYVTYEGELPT